MPQSSSESDFPENGGRNPQGAADRPMFPGASAEGVVMAGFEHRAVVLRLLDEFRAACSKLIAPERPFAATPAEASGRIFDREIESPNFAVFLARSGDEFVGIATVCKIPQIRRGAFCAEIEEMYVVPAFQGKGTAMSLVVAITEWAKENGAICLRLESSNELKRAHGFYEKAGFRHYGRAYEKDFRTEPLGTCRNGAPSHQF